MVSTVQGEWASRLFIRANAAAADSSIAVTNRLNPTNPTRTRISLAMTLPCSPLSRRRAPSLPLSLLSSAIRCSVTSRTKDNRKSAPTVIWDNSVEPCQLLLEVEQPSLVPGLDQLVDQRGGGGEADRQPPLAGGEPQAEGHVGLAG